MWPRRGRAARVHRRRFAPARAARAARLAPRARCPQTRRPRPPHAADGSCAPKWQCLQECRVKGPSTQVGARRSAARSGVGNGVANAQAPGAGRFMQRWVNAGWRVPGTPPTVQRMRQGPSGCRGAGQGLLAVYFGAACADCTRQPGSCKSGVGPMNGLGGSQGELDRADLVIGFAGGVGCGRAHARPPARSPARAAAHGRAPASKRPRREARPQGPALVGHRHRDVDPGDVGGIRGQLQIVAANEGRHEGLGREGGGHGEGAGARQGPPG
jgi:hypothetical protein